MLRVTSLFEGNSPVTGEFTAQRGSNAENVSIRWRHHEQIGACSGKDVSVNLFSIVSCCGFSHSWHQATEITLSTGSLGDKFLVKFESKCKTLHLKQTSFAKSQQSCIRDWVRTKYSDSVRYAWLFWLYGPAISKGTSGFVTPTAFGRCLFETFRP